jgi:hypothetical protein
MECRYIVTAGNDVFQVAQSRQDIASTILTYLTFSSFDGIFSDTPVQEDIEDQIKSKDFILFEYAAAEWLTHVRAYSSPPQDDSNDITNTLVRFIERRQN